MRHFHNSVIRLIENVKKESSHEVMRWWTFKM